MAQTSIHLRPCKQSSEIHNKREKELDYVRADLSQNNEWWSAVPSLGELRSEISAMVKDKTGRKMQTKAEPLREGVIVIDESTTMEQLQELGRRFQERFGVTPVQIAIHRDEGHWKEDRWQPNLHAHIVFDWYDHNTGKSIKTSKSDAMDMQTITADVLNMERGKSSDKKHMDSLRFKIQQQEQEIKEKEQRIEELEKRLEHANEREERLKGAFEGAKQGVSDLFTGKARKRAVNAEKRATEAEKRKNKALSDAMGYVARAKEIAVKAEQERDFIKKEWNFHKKELQDIEDFKQRAVSAEKRLNDLEKKIGWRDRMIEKFIEYGAVVSDQWHKLFQGEVIHSDHIRMNGIKVSLDNPIGLKLDKDKNFMIHDQHWVTETGFWNGIRKGITNAFNKGSEVYSWVLQHMKDGIGMKR